MMIDAKDGIICWNTAIINFGIGATNADMGDPHQDLTFAAGRGGAIRYRNISGSVKKGCFHLITLTMVYLIWH